MRIARQWMISRPLTPILGALLLATVTDTTRASGIALGPDIVVDSWYVQYYLQDNLNYPASYHEGDHRQTRHGEAPMDEGSANS